MQHKIHTDSVLFTRLSNDVRPRLFRQALHLSHNPDEAEDIVQETLIRAGKRFDTFDASRSFLNWTLRIMANVFIDIRRKDNRRPDTQSFEDIADNNDNNVSHFDVEDSSIDILGDVIKAENRSELIALFDRLPEMYRDALRMDIEGLSYEEIAKAQETNIGTVRSRIFRARKQLAAIGKSMA